MRYTAIILLSALSLTACKDDKLSSKSLLEGTGYGLLNVDLDEGVFSQTQINFKEFMGRCGQFCRIHTVTINGGVVRSGQINQADNVFSDDPATCIIK